MERHRDFPCECLVWLINLVFCIFKRIENARARLFSICQKTDFSEHGLGMYMASPTEASLYISCYIVRKMSITYFRFKNSLSTPSWLRRLRNVPVNCSFLAICPNLRKRHSSVVFLRSLRVAIRGIMLTWILYVSHFCYYITTGKIMIILQSAKSRQRLP